MKYQVYYLGSKCKASTAGSACILNMKNRNNNGKFASYISSMAEPTIEVSNDIVTMYFEPIPVAIATEIVAERRLKFQVVRHKANSSHTKKINFPYEFEFHTYWNHGQYNEKWGLSIPNNGPDVSWNIVTYPTVEELTSGVIERDMSGLFNNVKFCKCQTGHPVPWTAEYYFGFIYWQNWNQPPGTFKMAYYSITA